MASIKELGDIANALKRDVLLSTSAAGSGHPTSCLSSAEIVTSLFFNEMSYSPSDPSDPDSDEFVLSKGHAAPLLYSALKRAGCIEEDIMKLRNIGSPLEGHPVPSSLGWVKLATGSLGQGLSVATGMAMASKMQKRKFRVYCLVGDGEMAEGSNYEAMQIASFYGLNNLCVIVDINRLGQTGETMLGHDIKTYQKRFESFGWEVIQVNGHNIQQITSAFDLARKSQKPVAILAKTYKGYGVPFIEDKNGWHGKALDENDLKKALKAFPETPFPEVSITHPEKHIHKTLQIKSPKMPVYNLGEQISTREAYGQSLASITQSNGNVLALDSEVSNSTFSENVKKSAPKQFIECFIAEQNMIGMALGLSLKGQTVFASTFSSFLTRAHDQLRMSSISLGNFTVCGSHCGVSIGEDGASQMGLEDISMFRSMPGTTILYPSDAVSTSKLVQTCASLKGIKYIRTTRPKTAVIYDNNDTFPIGEFKVVKESSSDQFNGQTKKLISKKKKSSKKEKFKPEKDELVLIGSGITLHESIEAYKELKLKGINSAVIDLYCIKPLNVKALIEFIKQHGSRIVVAEDHYKEGGIGEMLTSAFANTDIKIKCLSVDRVPHSGTKDQLLDRYSINSRAIIDAAKEIIKVQ